MDGLDRFINYAKVDTKADENSTSHPSNIKELDLIFLLKKECQDLGLDVEVDKHGNLYGYLPGDKTLETIGLNAHVDTATELTDTHVNPQIIRKYKGEEIKLGKYKMSIEDFPDLKRAIGSDIVTTDGTTLLGADDKAGLAIIMSALEYYIEHKEEKHHPIVFAFTCDEEIGLGAEFFDKSKFNATYAYTLDGGPKEVVNIENFNAASGKTTINGLSIHPGSAKDKMVNAIDLAGEFITMFPQDKKPQHTEGHEGFNHFTHIEGEVDKTVVEYIIRNHDKQKLDEQIEEIKKISEVLQEKYPKSSIITEINYSYKNMLEILSKDKRAIDKVEKVYNRLGIKPVYDPIRGGTDGATFSFKGVPTPNLGTGGYNCHGRFEYLVVNEFYDMINIVIELLRK